MYAQGKKNKKPTTRNSIKGKCTTHGRSDKFLYFLHSVCLKFGVWLPTCGNYRLSYTQNITSCGASPGVYSQDHTTTTINVQLLIGK